MDGGREFILRWLYLHCRSAPQPAPTRLSRWNTDVTPRVYCQGCIAKKGMSLTPQVDAALTINVCCVPQVSYQGLEVDQVWECTGGGAHT